MYAMAQERTGLLNESGSGLHLASHLRIRIIQGSTAKIAKNSEFRGTSIHSC